MVNEKYSMSFSTGGLFYLESITLARLYLDLRDWLAVRTRVMAHNLLQARTLNTAKRVSREIISRLKPLTDDEISVLDNNSRQEQNYILWLAVCKRYRFIHDFAVEVVREKFLRLDFQLTYQDYHVFFNTKAEWHEEMERLAQETQIKLRQLLFKMLREAGLLSNHTIIPAMLTPQLVKTICKNSRTYLAVFPISDADIRVLCQ
jgi:hypothetical protein